MRIALLSLFLVACSSTQTNTPDAGMTMDAPPSTSVVGKDLDEHTPRTLKSDCPLPAAYGDAIKTSGLTSKQIAMPDLGISNLVDPQRLHWTDEIREAGDTAPSFLCMVAGDVEDALEHDDDTLLRELFVAQGIYGNRDAYVVSRYDRAFSIDPNDKDSLVKALQKYYERGGGSFADVKDDAIAQASTFSPQTRTALAQTILALIAAADLRDQALTASGMLTMDAWAAQIKTYMLGRKGGGVAAYDAADTMTKAMDFDLLSRAGQLAGRAVESLRIALAKEPPSDAALDFAGPLGRIVVTMKSEDNTYANPTDVFLLVDRDGSDTYQDNVAVNLDLAHPISIVLDLAGNDHYTPTKKVDPVGGVLPVDRGQGTGQAAAWFGVTILDDNSGDDEYVAGYFQAFGTYGVGALIDHAGADTYKGYNRSQGASDFGFGLLVDLGKSNDKYETLHNSQGFGGPHGIGWLVDDGGDDQYLAITKPIQDPQNNPYDQEGSNFSGAQGFGWGLRGGGTTMLSGGMGAVFDLGGNDKYECAVMCQAWGYFFGTGMLYDKSGDDSYVTWHKYGIGGATHQSIGVFYDARGKDKYEYTAGGIPTNGGSEGVGLGYDMGIGFHIDRGLEDDTYSFLQDKMQWGEVVGISRFVGLGVFLNEGGADAYHIPGKMGAYALGMTDMPAANYRANAGATNTASVGLFFDLGGTDTYDQMGSPAANNSSWKQTAGTTNAMNVFDPKLDFGYGLDGEVMWPAWPK